MRVPHLRLQLILVVQLQGAPLGLVTAIRVQKWQNGHRRPLRRLTMRGCVRHSQPQVQPSWMAPRRVLEVRNVHAQRQERRRWLDRLVHPQLLPWRAGRQDPLDGHHFRLPSVPVHHHQVVA